MKKLTVVAVIAALALSTQAFAMGGSTKGGQTMSSTKSATTMNILTTGTHAITPAAPMNGTGTMATAMTAAGTTKTMMSPASPNPAATK